MTNYVEYKSKSHFDKKIHQVFETFRKLIQLDAEPSLQLGSLLRYILDSTSPKSMPLTLYSVLGQIKFYNLPMQEADIFEEFNKVVIKSIKIIEPADVKKYSMMMGLPTGVLLTCILSNCTTEDIKNFRIRVKFCDTYLAVRVFLGQIC